MTLSTQHSFPHPPIYSRSHKKCGEGESERLPQNGHFSNLTCPKRSDQSYTYLLSTSLIRRA